MSATYKFYYTLSGNSTVQKKDYISSVNVNNVAVYFLSDNPNVSKIERIDIIADPNGINTDHALGYN